MKIIRWFFVQYDALLPPPIVILSIWVTVLYFVEKYVPL